MNFRTLINPLRHSDHKARSLPPDLHQIRN